MKILQRFDGTDWVDYSLMKDNPENPIISKMGKDLAESYAKAFPHWWRIVDDSVNTSPLDSTTNAVLYRINFDDDLGGFHRDAYNLVQVATIVRSHPDCDVVGIEKRVITYTIMSHASYDIRNRLDDLESLFGLEDCDE